MIKKLLNSGIFWTIFIGLIGIVLTILFYEYSTKDREPVYAIKKEPSIIFDKENSTPKIKLLSNDSSVINENVYVLTLVIWNNGELEIKKSDVRKDFTISIANQGEILDYKIVKQTNPEIGNFKILPVEEKLKIDWDYFDPNFGIEIQVIYSGNEDSKLIVEGYVLGNEIKKVIPRNSNNFITLLIFFISFQLIIMTWQTWETVNRYKEHLSKTRLFYESLILIMFIFIIIYLFYLLYHNLFNGIELPI